MKAILINGVFYRSFAEACDGLGLNYTCVMKYKARHKCDFETAVYYYFTGKVRQGRPGTPVRCGKKRYPSLTAACRELGVSPSTIRYIVKRHNCHFQAAYYTYYLGRWR